MKISASKIYTGPSIFAQSPVIHFILDGLEDSSYAEFDQNFLDSLLDMLPGLRNHLDGCVAHKFIDPENTDKGLRVGHIFEHVCIELQLLAENEVACARTTHHGFLSASEAAVPYEVASVCTAAAELCCELFRSLLPEGTASDADGASFDFEEELETYISRAQRRMLPVQDRAMARAALARGIPVNRLVHRLLILGQGRYQKRISGTHTALTSSMSAHIASNKDYCRLILDGLGLPSPRYERVVRSRDAVAAAKRIGFPVVVKPNNGSMGRAVSVGMRSAREVRAAFKRAREISRSVLIEELIEGADFRMMVINGELRAASQRIPGHVVGDGIHTVEELVDEINSDPRRGEGTKFTLTRIDLDEQAERLLEQMEYTRNSIPVKDEIVYLRRNANTSSGGTAVDVTDMVHPDNQEIAVRAAKAVGLDVAGVDLLTEDISKSIWDNGGAICEINSRPGLRKHIWPTEGKPRDVIGAVLDMLYPAGTRHRIKIVAVTGTDSGKREITARLLANMLTEHGCYVGLATEGHVYINGKVAGAGQLSSPEATRMIFLDPDIDTAVLEVDPDDVLEHGLGFDECDVCAIIDSTAEASEEAANDPSNASGAVDREADADDAIRVLTRTANEVVFVSNDAKSWDGLTIDSSAAHIFRMVIAEEQAEDEVYSKTTGALKKVAMAMSSRRANRSDTQQKTQ